jgi:hypothetical protein
MAIYEKDLEKALEIFTLMKKKYFYPSFFIYIKLIDLCF